MAEEPWGCPWCGEAADIKNNDGPDSQRSIMEFERWLEEHVTACEPWLAENGSE